MSQSASQMTAPRHIDGALGEAGGAQTLVSVAVVGSRPDLSGEQLAAGVVEQLRGWWGPQVDAWHHLRTYRIPFAQPNQVCLRKIPSSDMSLQEPRAAPAIVCASVHVRGAIVD